MQPAAPFILVLFPLVLPHKQGAFILHLLYLCVLISQLLEHLRSLLANQRACLVLRHAHFLEFHRKTDKPSGISVGIGHVIEAIISLRLLIVTDFHPVLSQGKGDIRGLQNERPLCNRFFAESIHHDIVKL